MKKSLYSLIPTLVLGIIACGDDEAGSSAGSIPDAWLIPSNEVIEALGRDGIPSLQNPEFTTPQEADNTYLFSTDLVIGYKSGNEVRAYPHKILDWHEIVNDMVDGKSLAITYCPLTGTAIGWETEIDGEETTFGVSGLLYNTNLILFDRKTDSKWSQMLLQSVNGELIGTHIQTFQVVETTWAFWKAMYPQTKVLSINTGHSRNYLNFPYGEYRNNDNLILFPFTPEDSRLPNKDRVHGVIVDGEAKVYPLNVFEGDIQVVEDGFHGLELVVVGSKNRNFINSFERGGLTFTAVQDGGDVIMQDNEGNTWDVFGVAKSGPRQGQQLTPTQSFIGYWFSWGAFYPNPEIYDQG